MPTVRLAVVGAGSQCTASLMPGIPYIPEIDLVGVCDLKRELAERNGRRFGARAVYVDVAEMLRQEAPDAVMVVGPPQMHEEIGLQVLEAGAHLLVEKPVAPTVEGGSGGSQHPPGMHDAAGGRGSRERVRVRTESAIG